MKKGQKEKMILRIAELIGQLKSSQIKVNGESGQVIIGGESLILFLKEIQDLLLTP